MSQLAPESVGATMVSDFEVEMEAFPGRGPRRINLKKAAPFGWTSAIMLGGVGLVDRAENTVLAGSLSALKDEFGINELQTGILLSAPSIAALLLVVPAGKFADTRNRTWILSIVIGIWSLLSFGSALAPTFALFFLARLLLGTATPLTIPASASLAGDLYPTAVRSRAFAILRAMEYFGLPLGLVIGGVISDAYGWRAAFLVMGVPALILALTVRFVVREPKRGLADEISQLAEAANAQTTLPENSSAMASEAPSSTVSGPSNSSIVVDASAKPISLDKAAAFDPADPGLPINVEQAMGEDSVELSMLGRIKQVLSIRTLRYIILGQMLLFAGFSGLFSTVTIYFERINDLGAKEATLLTGPVGSLGLILGSIIGSIIGDRVARKNPGGRVTIAASSLALSALCLVLFVITPGLLPKIVLFVFINAFNITALANIGASTSDVLPASKRGSGFGIAQFLITIGSSTGALLVFAISQLVINTSFSGQETTEALKQGISFGIASLILPFSIGAVLIFAARKSFDRDASSALADANSGLLAPSPQIH